MRPMYEYLGINEEYLRQMHTGALVVEYEDNDYKYGSCCVFKEFGEGPPDERMLFVQIRDYVNPNGEWLLAAVYSSLEPGGYAEWKTKETTHVFPGHVSFLTITNAVLHLHKGV